MDDDVKNLFQKFGQSTEAYREINRDADSEQAKLRWPLLRDVHLHSGPAPARAHHREEEPAVSARHTETPFRATAVKTPAPATTASRAAATKAAPSPVATDAHANSKPAAQLSLKQMLLQQAAVEEQEPEAEVTAPFLSRILPASPKQTTVQTTAQNTATRKEATVGGLFSGRSQAAPARQAEVPAHSAPVSVSVNTPAPLASARKPVNVNPVSAPAPVPTPAPASIFIHSIPAAHVAPANVAARHASEEVLTQRVAAKVSAKDQPVSAVFGRLAGKQEDARPVDTGSNSFFKKIFKP
ncbi:cellulose biosynthesis protein BcsP [Undibacterium pigrum]|uniref:Cellulose biosynthesis protein BcsR n=1 Tax=Undibacterium pigrum TaxID=401470 RepID=A0A318IPF2_9BURK|nr:cellulose biosynthesis protein BcsP [Undibacterium pigrum]PXX37349.1 hypothetical protein DFR42_11644 [Undibacterium pigrum]